MTAAPTDTAERFSATLRSETAGDHRGAERSGFMDALVSGALPLAGYTDMLAQHWYAYERIESHGSTLKADPVAAAFIDDSLLRLPALSADLEDLVGPRWQEQHPATAATQEY